MPDRQGLEQILSDPHSTPEERAMAQSELGPAKAEEDVAELLRYAKTSALEDIPWEDVSRFCSERGWRKTRDLYERWLHAFFNTEGRKDLERIAHYMRKCDLEQWDFAAREWEDSDWRNTAPLVAVLERIADSPNRGNYHARETVKCAEEFLIEMKRRSNA
jgi:hypothetical protein